MKIHKELEQRSDEWFEKRKGKMSASNGQAIQASGKGLETYVLEILANKYSDSTERYMNDDMQRGIDLEDAGREVYEIEHGASVEQVGLIEYDDFFVASPDGLTKDGMIEIKCMNDKNHFKFIVERKIETKWIWQMQAQMLASGRQWVDFVAYNPNFDQSLVVVREVIELAKQEKLLMGLEMGKRLLLEMEEKFNNSNK